MRDRRGVCPDGDRALRNGRDGNIDKPLLLADGPSADIPSRIGVEYYGGPLPCLEGFEARSDSSLEKRIARQSTQGVQLGNRPAPAWVRASAQLPARFPLSRSLLSVSLDEAHQASKLAETKPCSSLTVNDRYLDARIL